uniref:Uncharacterized protein n=1 Tax=Beihai levi-like virus 8 TaxID=1922426 RepID=A0A1L3KI56_9VIRU|nr:hypothetical protein [Beihai levi-like virus 8]
MTTVWNAIPWSWLVDYFLQVGNFLEAQQGYYRSTADQMCLMSKSELEAAAMWHAESSYWEPGMTWDSGLAKFTHLRRKVVYHPKPQLLYRPFLTLGQLSILGALSTSRTTTFFRSG